jgi:hypothetical protein
MWRLAETDILHDTLSGRATKQLMQRVLLVFGDNPHCAAGVDLGGASTCGRRRLPDAQVHKAQGAPHRHRDWRTPSPPPDGRPGYLRIDSVHQGDEDGGRGLPHERRGLRAPLGAAYLNTLPGFEVALPSGTILTASSLTASSGYVKFTRNRSKKR